MGKKQKRTPQAMNRFDVGYIILGTMANLTAVLNNSLAQAAGFMAFSSQALDAKKVAKADAKAFENSVLEDLERLPEVHVDG